MLALAHSELPPLPTSPEAIPSIHNRVSAESICRDIPVLVSQNLMLYADDLSLWGLQQFPDHEEILALRALVCEVRQDWSGADQALGMLAKLQNYRSPPQTWLHWVRVLRCLGELERALSTIREARLLHPSDLELLSEWHQLRDKAVSD